MTTAAQGSSLRILIVDGDAARATAACQALALRGHRLSLASDSADALRCVERRKFDVALIELDWVGLVAEICAISLAQADPTLAVISVSKRTCGPSQLSTSAAFAAHLISPVQVDVFEKAFAFVQRVRGAQDMVKLSRSKDLWHAALP